MMSQMNKLHGFIIIYLCVYYTVHKAAKIVIITLLIKGGYQMFENILWLHFLQEWRHRFRV